MSMGRVIDPLTGQLILLFSTRSLARRNTLARSNRPQALAAEGLDRQLGHLLRRRSEDDPDRHRISGGERGREPLGSEADRPNQEKLGARPEVVEKKWSESSWELPIPATPPRRGRRTASRAVCLLVCFFCFG